MSEPNPESETPQEQAPAEKSLEELLAEAQARIEQQREQMMRALADADNARKRARAEAAALQKYAGERFDPHRHQAVAVLEAGAEPNTIVSVMQKGYVLHDRVIRPALVTVAKALESGAGNPISESDLNTNSGT